MTITTESLLTLLAFNGEAWLKIGGLSGIFQGVTRESGSGDTFNIHLILINGDRESFFVRLGERDKLYV